MVAYFDAGKYAIMLKPMLENRFFLRARVY